MRNPCKHVWRNHKEFIRNSHESVINPGRNRWWIWYEIIMNSPYELFSWISREIRYEVFLQIFTWNSRDFFSWISWEFWWRVHMNFISNSWTVFAGIRHNLVSLASFLLRLVGTSHMQLRAGMTSYQF